MKGISISAVGLSLLGQVLAHPHSLNRLSRRQAPPIGDVDLVQFALSLEQLESAFYQLGLSKFSELDFLEAGLSSRYFFNLQEIAFDEQFHVALLSDALTEVDVKPVQPCNYSFPFTDVKSFVSLATVLEAVGTSAYEGSGANIKTPELQENAQAILPNEAAHLAVQRAAAHEDISPNPRGQPLTPNEVETLAASFIVSCPSSNMVLPFKAFPPLTVTSGPGPYLQNTLASFAVTGTLPSPFFVTYVSGTNTKTSVPVNVKGNTFQAAIGDNMSGPTYVVVSQINSNSTLNETNIAFGPTEIEVDPLGFNITAFDNGL